MAVQGGVRRLVPLLESIIDWQRIQTLDGAILAVGQPLEQIFYTLHHVFTKVARDKIFYFGKIRLWVKSLEIFMLNYEIFWASIMGKVEERLDLPRTATVKLQKWAVIL